MPKLVSVWKFELILQPVQVNNTRRLSQKLNQLVENTTLHFRVNVEETKSVIEVDIMQDTVKPNPNTIDVEFVKRKLREIGLELIGGKSQWVKVDVKGPVWVVRIE